jgi:ubiquinone biosynthesis monooxygenase Coq7
MTSSKKKPPSKKTALKMTGDDCLPGDLDGRALVNRMIRVDHAGEYGALRIYEGQMAVLGTAAAGGTIAHMADQERDHLAAFEKLIRERRVRPTALTPLWHLGGFALGAATAALGPRAAMACTAAVEEVIDHHYASQIEQLGEDEADLRASMESCRADEVVHRDIAYEHGAREAPGYGVLTGAIKAGTRLAIWLSERV